MNQRQTDQVKWLRGITVFLRANAHVLHRIARSALLPRLEDLVTQLGEHREEQVTASIAVRTATARYHALREALVCELIMPLVAMAQLVVKDAWLLDLFTVPPHNGRVEPFVLAARKMAAESEPYARAFTAAGMPRNFRRRLDRATTAIEAMLERRARYMCRRNAATLQISAQLRDGRLMVRVLDSLVRADAMNDPTLWAVWSTVKRAPASERRGDDQASSRVAA